MLLIYKMLLIDKNALDIKGDNFIGTKSTSAKLTLRRRRYKLGRTRERKTHQRRCLWVGIFWYTTLTPPPPARQRPQRAYWDWPGSLERRCNGRLGCALPCDWRERLQVADGHVVGPLVTLVVMLLGLLWCWWSRCWALLWRLQKAVIDYRVQFEEALRPAGDCAGRSYISRWTNNKLFAPINPRVRAVNLRVRAVNLRVCGRSI